MQARLPIAVAATLAVLATAAGAGAVTGRIVVTPTSPKAGARATIAVRLSIGSGDKQPTALYLRVTSPKGAVFRTSLTHGGPGTWRTAFVFLGQGQWRLSIVAGSGGSPAPGSVLGTATVRVR
ncbi:MAG TPA: hypothetical protein VMT59_07165 [Gaiellaceae bacterium]|nr:hypothetical protein [Gaiellaceae bacterium]